MARLLNVSVASTTTVGYHVDPDFTESLRQTRLDSINRVIPNVAAFTASGLDEVRAIFSRPPSLRR